MENAVEAIKIAGWMLIFIVALSFSMNALTFVRQNVDSILTDNDREYLTKFVEGNSKTNPDGTITYTTERLVGIESVLPTIYRAFEEELVIKFDTSLFKYTTYGGSSVEVSELDSRKINLSKIREGKYIDEFVNCIMYGGTCTPELADKIQFMDYGDKDDKSDDKFITPKNINFGDGLYKILSNNGNKLYESVGIYYEQDVNGGTPDLIESQKTEQRIIRYSTK